MMVSDSITTDYELTPSCLLVWCRFSGFWHGLEVLEHYSRIDKKFSEPGLSSLPKLYSASVPLRHALPHEDGLVYIVHYP